MSDDSTDLIPSEDEIKQLVAQIMEANLANAPMALLQIELARMMLRFIDKMRGNLAESIDEFERNTDKLV